ncbi:MAG: hypothetical protein Q4G66_10330 [bacterium]|nr:hypothetical protein [bacterium]
MTLIDFTKDREKAFRHGFMKGLAAPVMLFGVFSTPEIPQVEPIDLNELIPPKNILDDMETVQGDFIRALKRTP